MNVGDLYTKFDFDIKELEKGSKRAKTYLNDVDKSVGKVDKSNVRLHTSLAKSAVKMLALGAASAVVVGTLKGVTSHTLEYGNRLDKLNKRLGVSAEEMDKLRQVGELSGVQFNTLAMAMQRLQRRGAEAANGLGEAKGALQELNIPAEELAKMSLDEQLITVSKALSQVKDNGDKTRLAFKLFDAEGVALLQMTDNLEESLKNVNSQWDDEKAKKIAKFNDNITILKENFQQNFLPIITKVVGSFNELFARFDESSELALSKKIEELKEDLKEAEEDVVTFTKRADDAWTNFTRNIHLKNKKEAETRAKDTKKELDETEKLYDEAVKRRIANEKKVVEGTGGTTVGGTTDAEKKKAEDLANFLRQLETERLALLGKNKEAELAMMEDKYLKLGQKYKDNYDVLNQLTENAAIERNAIEKRYADERIELLKKERESWEASLDSLIDDIMEAEAIAKESELPKWFQENEDALKSLGSSIKSNLVDKIADASIFTKKGLSELSQEISQLMIKMALMKTIESAAGGYGGVVGAMFGGGRATGGPTEAGKIYRINEREPEFFQSNESGKITPLSKMAGSIGGNTTITNNISVTQPVGGSNIEAKRFGYMISKSIDEQVNKSLVKAKRNRLI